MNTKGNLNILAWLRLLISYTYCYYMKALEFLMEKITYYYQGYQGTTF